jgi:uncharacterized protein (DUF2249 family)
MTEPTSIDLRGMPMDPRHQLLFATLYGLEPGDVMEVTNDHDPSGWTWLEQGPVDWRFRVVRLGEGPVAS